MRDDETVATDSTGRKLAGVFGDGRREGIVEDPTEFETEGLALDETVGLTIVSVFETIWPEMVASKMDRLADVELP